jgi:hypothetical protein
MIYNKGYFIHNRTVLQNRDYWTQRYCPYHKRMEKSHSDSYLQRGQMIIGLKLQTCQFSLSGLQANATRYSIVPEEYLG